MVKMEYTKIKAIQEELKNKGIITEIIKNPSFDGWDYSLFHNDNKLNIRRI